MNGAKRITETMAKQFTALGRGAFSDRYKLNCKDRFIVDQRSENVGISNEKTGEIPVHRKSKVSVRSDYPLRVSRHLSRGQLE